MSEKNEQGRAHFLDAVRLSNQEEEKDGQRRI
jgi:hypothetical protein